MKPIITISGTPGSGKSTIAKALVEKYKAKRVYGGAMWRQIAKDRSMTLMELQKKMINNSEVDIEVDKKATKETYKLAKDNIVIAEGRPLYHFIPESIKIFIKVDVTEGAKRIWLSMQKEENRKARNEANVNSLEELIEKTEQRKTSNINRYTKFYGIDHTDESQYDFVLDTTDMNIQQATQKVIDFIDNKLK
ncbi:AAA family ATPase [Candidatus Parcubacteria bacterium]|jgi:predicted cytidylate kinase|nr:AAA family ATPase [Candidatus Parcubacteria bacterium]